LQAANFKPQDKINSRGFCMSRFAGESDLPDDIVVDWPAVFAGKPARTG
jgi:hypothetical protein